MKTWKVVYNLLMEDCRPGLNKGVAFVQAKDRADASYKFKQMGIRFFTIDAITEV